jgi:glutathione peroxidase-family protein
LYAKYNEQGLRILAFPCNQFGGQVNIVLIFFILVGFILFAFKEPWPEPEIKEFVKQYNVQFDMFSKINVNGPDAHPLFNYLKGTCGGTMGDFIKWNFTKFLVNKNGEAVKRFAPNVKPLDFEQDIVNLLKE